MKVYKRILIAMDLSDHDDSLIRFVRSMVANDVVEVVKGVHVISHEIHGYALNAVHPEAKDLNFIAFFEKVRASAMHRLREGLNNNGLKLEMQILEGKPYRQLVKHQKENDADLLVIGQKEASSGSGITPRRIANHCECDVAIVPLAKPAGEPEKILVPIDFSDNSARALKQAIDYKKIHKKTYSVIGLHFMDIPSPNLFQEYILYQEILKMIPDEARVSYEEFMHKHGLQDFDMSMHFEFLQGVNLGVAIHDYAVSKDCGAIFIGAQGHSAIEKFVYGSVTESLLGRSLDMPVLVIR